MILMVIHIYTFVVLVTHKAKLLSIHPEIVVNQKTIKALQKCSTDSVVTKNHNTRWIINGSKSKNESKNWKLDWDKWLGNVTIFLHKSM